MISLSGNLLIVRLATIDLTRDFSPLRNLDTLLYSHYRKIKLVLVLLKHLVRL